MGTHSQGGSHRVRHSRGFFAQHGYLEVPSLVQWMATLRCGLSCAHCLAVSEESGFSEMPLEKVKNLIDQIAQMGVEEFLITGGEPLVREDLGEIIEYLGHKSINWTLNTAAMPEEGLRRVLARHRPGFVAVSLDGPRPVHDAFRGKAGAWDKAMEAIRFFRSLAGVRVCAGTTVTSRNYDVLDETFHIVTGSGADRWGIHLLVPEGRAADRPDLFLSRTQLKRLIKFVARKRRYFPVEMADEIGYLGYLEPLVRDMPLTCGAGRSQCVVLPDGEVVPCTTLDRSCSAGNIHERPLREIWEAGFRDLRAWRPSGKCGRCDYAVGCRGGCWLQRKVGTQCFKEVWHVPGALKTAAGIAICLGGLAAYPEKGLGQQTPAAMPGGDDAIEIAPLALAGESSEVVALAAPALDAVIMAFYADQAMGRTPVSSWSGFDPNEPAWKFLLDFRGGTLLPDVLERCAAVSNALETQERSLSFAALLWRAVSEPLFDPNSVTVYSESEREVIRETLAAISLKAQEWRLQIFEENLDPYLSNGRETTPRCMLSKAPGIGYCIYDEPYYLANDLNEERWGAGTTPDSREAAQEYLQNHQYADQMNLRFTFFGYDAGQLLRYRGGQSEVIGVLDRDSTRHTLEPFDVIQTLRNCVLRFEVQGSTQIDSPWDPNYADLLDDGTKPRPRDLVTVLCVSLEAGHEYTYVELLNLVYQQHKDALLSMAYDWIEGTFVPLWEDERVYVIAAVQQNGALLWPAIRDILGNYCPAGAGGENPEGETELPLSDVGYRRAMFKDADFWMF